MRVLGGRLYASRVGLCGERLATEQPQAAPTTPKSCLLHLKCLCPGRAAPSAPPLALPSARCPPSPKPPLPQAGWLGHNKAHFSLTKAGGTRGLSSVTFLAVLATSLPSGRLAPSCKARCVRERRQSLSSGTWLAAVTRQSVVTTKKTQVCCGHGESHTLHRGFCAAEARQGGEQCSGTRRTLEVHQGESVSSVLAFFVLSATDQLLIKNNNSPPEPTTSFCPISHQPGRRFEPDLFFSDQTQ